MEVLMLRFDIFDLLHKDLYIFWREVLTNIKNDNVTYFGFTIANSSYAESSLPELFMLCEERLEKGSLLDDMEGAQRYITEDLNGQMVDINGTHDLILLRPLTEEEELSKDEFYEINESIRVLNREIEKILIIIRKEMKKFWSKIDALIIYSYKQLLYDVTGSDDFVKAFMSEMKTFGIISLLDTDKRNQDYEGIINTVGILDEQIENWIVDIEHLVGASQ